MFKRIKKYLYKKNIEHITQILESNDSSIFNEEMKNDLQYRRAIYYTILEQYKEAIADYNAVIASALCAPEHYKERGILHFMTENYEGAVKDLSFYIEQTSEYKVSSEVLECLKEAKARV